MKANELRLNNYVNNCGEIITVDGIDDNDVFNKNIGEIPLHSIQPIQITEQWLIVFGFEKKGDVFYNIPIKNKGILWVYLEREFCELGTICGYSFAEIDCKHIHQLQNLHFALTGTELSKK